MKKPPVILELKFCPVCGRNDRYQPFTGRKHHSGGKECAGSDKLVRVVYDRRS